MCQKAVGSTAVKMLNDVAAGYSWKEWCDPFRFIRHLFGRRDLQVLRDTSRWENLFRITADERHDHNRYSGERD